MANTENINMNGEVFDTAVEAVEAIPVKPSYKLGVIAAVVLTGGVLIPGIALGIHCIKKKKAMEAAAAAAAEEYVDVDDDFDEE